MIRMIRDTMIFIWMEIMTGRYNSDPDYADGVDDAMDEFDEEW